MADITNRIAGVVYLKVDGNQYALKGNLTVSPDLIERTGVAGQDGVHGYTEQVHVPYISGDISDSAGLSLEDLRAITNSTVTAELAAPPNGLARLPGVHDLDVQGNRVRLQVDTAELNAVLRALTESGVRSLTSTPPTLEELFLRHYQAEQAEGAEEVAAR